MNRKKRNPDELKTVSDESIYYELDMLNKTADILQKEQADKVLHDALLESFLLHARNLYEFFNPTSFIEKKEESVIAKDFFDVPNSLGKADIPSFDKDKANKLLSHISYERMKQDQNSKCWPRPKIRQEINNAMKKFIGRVAGNKISNKLKKYSFPADTSEPAVMDSTGLAVE